MLDKIFLRSNDLNSYERLIENINGISNRHQGVKDNHFKNACVFYRGGEQFFTIKANPPDENRFAVRIEFNPSKLEGFGELKRIFMNTSFFEGAEVIRLDHCADLRADIADLYSKTRVKYKRGRRIENIDHVSGLYFGNRPEVYLLYDKAYTPRNKYGTKLKPNRSYEKGKVVRLEVRQFDKRTSISSLIEVPKLVKLNPFEKLISVNFKDSNKGRSLEEMSKQNGFSRVYSYLNSSNNFSKTFNQHLEIVDIQGSFLREYQNRLKEFLT